MGTKKLADLDDMEFENLTFDLMIAHGMSNVTWRTPGADGGRDIEGHIIQNDFSLIQTTHKWYVECKRYKKTIDWFTIYKKIAFAESNAVDVLLLCTTAKFSPTAISEVEKWNRLKRMPIIRLWPGHQIDILLKKYQDIAWKYGLENTPSPITGSTLDLTLALSKCVISHHSSLEFGNDEVSPMLKAAQSLSSLLQIKMENIRNFGKFGNIFYEPKQFHFSDVKISDVVQKVDGPSLNAFISYLIALGRKVKSITSEEHNTCLILFDEPIDTLIFRYKKTFEAIALWGDFEYTVCKETIKINQR